MLNKLPGEKWLWGMLQNLDFVTDLGSPFGYRYWELWQIGLEISDCWYLLVKSFWKI